MTRGTLLVCAALLAALPAPAPAGTTADGHEWPPDPSRYEADGTPIGGGLAVGDTLNAANAAKAKDLLPPEILASYQKGRYENRIVSWPRGLVHFDASFEQATKANAGRYALRDDGTIVEAAGGKQPEYVYGLPFPEVKPDDPQGGLKALWNEFYAWWINGSGLFHSKLVWVAPEGVNREAGVDIRYQFFDGQPEQYRLPNPQGFQVLSLQQVLSPADLQGTAALGHRFRDPAARDASWTYVPALRRVRAVSPANRSDGFLGSDLSQDDAHFFDGKPQDFTWKTVGVREGLRIVDPESVRGHGGQLRYEKDMDGFRTVWERNVPAAGYVAKDRKVFPWAPVSAALAKRRFWVVEGVPKDRYYLAGKIELWIDDETWQGAWNRKFSWQGELLNDYQVSSFLNHPVQRPGSAEVEWIWNSQHTWNCAENVKLDRATLVGIRLTQTAPLDRRVRFNVEQSFDLNTLARGGK